MPTLCGASSICSWREAPQSRVVPTTSERIDAANTAILAAEKSVALGNACPAMSRCQRGLPPRPTAEGDPGAVHERDNILRRALGRGCGGVVDCLSDPHVGPPGLRSFNGTPTSALARGRATMGCRFEFKPVERKITSRHGVDSRPLSERLRHDWGPAARVRRSFHEDSLERNSRPPRKTKGRLSFLRRWSTISPGRREAARVAREELDQPTSSRSPTPESHRWCSSR
jgi:hypothetical protein